MCRPSGMGAANVINGDALFPCPGRQRQVARGCPTTEQPYPVTYPMGGLLGAERRREDEAGLSHSRAVTRTC